MNSKWTSFTKSRIAPCLKILSCLCQHSQRHVSPISANSDRREVVMRDCTTNFKKRINSRQRGIFNTSVTGLCHAVCYLFRTKTFFCIKWIPKKKMVQFCYLRLYFGIDIVSQQTRYSTWFMVGRAWPGGVDQYKIITGASRFMRLVSYWWLYDLP